MSVELTMKKINQNNSGQAFFFARVDSIAKDVYKPPNQRNPTYRATGVLVDREGTAVWFQRRGLEPDIDKFAKDHRAGKIFKFANVGVRQIRNFQWTPSVLTKEFSLDGAEISPEIAPADVAAARPQRRAGSTTASGILRRLEIKRIDATLADITALVLNIAEPKRYEKETGSYDAQELKLSDGESTFDFTLWGEHVTQYPGPKLCEEDTITLLNVFAKLGAANKTKLSLSTVKKYPLDVFIDNDSAQAKMLDEKKDDVFDADDAADLPAMTQGFTSRKRATQAPCLLTTAQRLDTLLQETPPATMPRARLVELRSVVLPGLGQSSAKALSYEGCPNCKKKRTNALGRVNQEPRLNYMLSVPPPNLRTGPGPLQTSLYPGSSS